MNTALHPPTRFDIENYLSASNKLDYTAELFHFLTNLLSGFFGQIRNFTLNYCMWQLKTCFPNHQLQKITKQDSGTKETLYN